MDSPDEEIMAHNIVKKKVKEEALETYFNKALNSQGRGIGLTPISPEV